VDGTVFAYEGSSPEWEKVGEADLDVKSVCWLDVIDDVEGLRDAAEKSKLCCSGVSWRIGASWMSSGLLETESVRVHSILRGRKTHIIGAGW
jgi:hypothetical protein